MMSLKTMSKKLYKTTIVIWSEFDPSKLEIDDLAEDAVSGESYCSVSRTELIEEPEKDPEWDGTEFFHMPDE